MTVLITGAAGFIGFHVAKRLLEEGHRVLGLDNINDYYDINLKLARLAELGVIEPQNNVFVESVTYTNFSFIKASLEDISVIWSVFKLEKIDVVCNLAAQAGVRYSIENPHTYVSSNIVGFTNILEACKSFEVKKLVYASSSSVYGLNKTIPFSTDNVVDHPISLYAATKKSNELFAHTYSHLYRIETIGLRFFTVYGPWGRPDMAMFLFTDAILHDKPIKVFNKGALSRDFTYIDDIVSGIMSTLIRDKVQGGPMYRIYNIGNNQPVKLMDFIDEIEKATGKTAQKVFLPMQPGDVEKTWADISALKRDYGYEPTTTVSQGIQNFLQWYMSFYK